MSNPDLSNAQWRKSSHSGGGGGECVEASALDRSVALRDSKDPGGPKLIVPAANWRKFARRIKASQHDLA